MPVLLRVVARQFGDLWPVLERRGAEHLDVHAGQEIIDRELRAELGVDVLAAHGDQVPHRVRVLDVRFTEEVDDRGKALGHTGRLGEAQPGPADLARRRLHVPESRRDAHRRMASVAGPQSGRHGIRGDIGIFRPGLHHQVGLECLDDRTGAARETGHVIGVSMRDHHHMELAGGVLSSACVLPDLLRDRLDRARSALLRELGRSAIDQHVAVGSLLPGIREGHEETVAEADVVGPDPDLGNGAQIQRSARESKLTPSADSVSAARPIARRRCSAARPLESLAPRSMKPLFQR